MTKNVHNGLSQFARALVLMLFLTPTSMDASPNSKKVPFMEEVLGAESQLILPENLEVFLSASFPGYKLPTEKDFNPDMLQYYRSRLIGIHPAIVWGDFNSDKKQDYALLLITSESKWGPNVELVVLNNEGGDDFTPYRLGDIYDYKEDYLSWNGQKILKTRYKKSCWFLSWDKKTKTYTKTKS